VIEVIRANGTVSAAQPTIRAFPSEILQRCPLPARHTYPVTVDQAMIGQQWEKCAAKELASKEEQ